jgi:hypothetical protein
MAPPTAVMVAQRAAPIQAAAGVNPMLVPAERQGAAAGPEVMPSEVEVPEATRAVPAEKRAVAVVPGEP